MSNSQQIAGSRNRRAQRAAFLFSGVCAATLLLPAPALAQDGVGADAVASQGDDIVVTASRREQLSQDVPIALKAFNQDDLRAVGADQLQDLVRVIPNVTLYDDRGSGQPTWVIRGVGLADFNPNNTPTAAVFYDEFYLPSNALAGVGLFDIGRIEVLKGPQGGLYGRNTSGGAIRIVSQEPQLGVVGGYADLGYGSWNHFQAQGAVNVPLSDKAAMRFSAMTDYGGGWQDSLATPGDDNYGDKNLYAVRGQLLIEPTDTLRLLVKGEAGRDKSETALGVAIGSENLGAPSGFCAAILAGERDQQNCGTWADRNQLAMGDPIGPSAGDQSEDGRVVLSNPINKLNNQWKGVTGQVELDLGFATLASITGVLSYDYRQLFDYDGSELELGHETSDVHFDVWSQELRLTSNGNGPFTWLVGGAYNYDKLADTRTFSLVDNILAAPPPVNVARRSYEQKTEAWSVYGNFGYEFSDILRGHGSLRYTDEDKRMYNASLYIPPLGFYVFQDQSQRLKLKTNWTGDLGIDFYATPDAMLYAKATKGYKSGGFFGGLANDPGALAPYTEESIWSYEAGFKTEWDGGFRANGAGFFYDYQDRQGYLNKLNPLTNMTAVLLGNVGDVELYGAELELSWSPPSIPGLNLQFSPAYLRGKIVDSDATSYTITGTLYNLEGLPVNTPRWTLFGSASYEKPVSGKLKAGISFNYAWRRSPNGDLAHNANSPVTLGIYGIPSYGSMDGRIWLGTIDDKWQLSFEAKNLTNEHYWTVVTRDSGGSFMDFYNQPRNFRLRATYSF